MNRSVTWRFVSSHLVATTAAMLSVAAAGSACSGGASGGEGPIDGCAIDAAPLVEEGPTMDPGGDCIHCHAAEGEGPRYTVAGTVMDASDDADGCVGVGSVTVEIVDAEGQVTELRTNAVGNFYGDPTIVGPYTAKVVRDGLELAMATPQTETNCASCHTAEGANGAPGRILTPR